MVPPPSQNTVEVCKHITLLIRNYISSTLAFLTFKNPASYIYDGRTTTLQMLHFMYFFFNKYKY